MGYAQATAGGYGRPNVQAAPPPPRPPPASAAVAEASAAARHGFIRKVYSILTLQLLITFGVIAAFTKTLAPPSACTLPIQDCAAGLSIGVFFGEM